MAREQEESTAYHAKAEPSGHLFYAQEPQIQLLQREGGNHRKSRRYSSYKGKVGTIAPNRIRRRFHTTVPHQKIATDTTEFKYYEVDAQGHLTQHKLYLNPFMDMFNGEILSYRIAVSGSLSGSVQWRNPQL